VLDEVEKRRLSPLDVVPDDHERLFRCSLLQQRSRRHGRVRRRRERQDRLRVGPELQEHLDERPVRDPLAVVEAPAADDQRARFDLARELGDEARLPDARCAEQGEEVGRPLRDRVLEVVAKPP
jgi:hypothetical protein